MISELTWEKLHLDTIIWLCLQYDVCTKEDFKTLSALPDLTKHEPKILKYFDLHFFNNNYDYPPTYCRINITDALNQFVHPNLLKGVKVLLDNFNSSNNLSFIELSYLVHLLADLHQPFHCKYENVIIVLMPYLPYL